MAAALILECLKEDRYSFFRGAQTMNTNGRIWTSALVLAASVALQATAANAQSRIGNATSVKPAAQANARVLAPGAGVYSKDLINTGTAGVADLRFLDSTRLSVGPKSSVRLDKFVYDPNKSAGSVAIDVSRGAFRFVTGSHKGSYKVKTPYGTLGVRG